MRQKLLKTLMGLSLFSMCAVLTACSSDDDQTPDKDTPKVRQLTIANVPITRATLTEETVEGKQVLSAAWKAGDQATWFNISTFTDSNIDYGKVTALSDGVTSAFSGEITGYPAEGHNLALIYPATDIIPTGDDRGMFSIVLSGQKGTLTDIQKNYHYVYGVATIESVTESKVNATISTMKSLLSVCKFTFKDGSGNPIFVKSLSIGFGVDATTGYPQTATATPSATLNDVVATPIDPDYWTGLLTITLDEATSGGVYVALLPVAASSSFYFSVTTDSKETYTGTATATLSAGRYYPVTLKLNKI